MKKRISIVLLVAVFTLISCTSVVGAATSARAKSKRTTTTTPTTTTSTSVVSGAWIGSWPSSSENNIQEFNQLTNNQTKIIHTFVGSFQDINEWGGFMNYVHSQGAKNMLTLELKRSDYSDYSTVDVNNGELDEYFNRIAKQLKSWQNGSEIWLRPMHEVNGNWSGWMIGDSTVNTNASYKSAFQRIVKIFRANGATNVKFVYNVSCENVGENASFMGAYPGDTYVDYVSMDGYNWGTTQWWSSWKSFKEIFDPAYKALTTYSTKPVIIAEYASTEEGGDKAAWITDAKKQMSSGAYPRLKAAIWFNENKETDWRINSSSTSLAAYIK